MTPTPWSLIPSKSPSSPQKNANAALRRSSVSAAKNLVILCSTACAAFSQKSNQKVQKVSSEELPKLEEIEDDEEEVVRKISFKPLDF